MKTVYTSAAPQPIGPYSQAIEANGFIFCSGQIAIDSVSNEVVNGDIGVQTKQVIQNLSKVLESTGLKLTDVVKTSVYLKNIGDFPRFNEVYSLYFNDSKPARSTVEVSALPKGVLIEMDVVAVR